MSENYATNRIVTKSYLQNCERAAGPLQGGGGSGFESVSFDLGIPNSGGIFENVDATTKDSIKNLMESKTIIIIKLETKNEFIKLYGNCFYQESHADNQNLKSIILNQINTNYFGFTINGTDYAIVAHDALVESAPNENYILTLYYL